MRRIELIKFWASPEEKKAIDASAKLNGITRAEYCRSCCVGRPVKARARLFRAERQLQRQRLREEAEDRERQEQVEARKAEDKRILEAAKVLEKQRKRLEKAQSLIAEAGGSVQAWWDGLSARHRETWADLMPELEHAEQVAQRAGRVSQEASAVWEKERCEERLQAPVVQPRWVPPTVPPGRVQAPAPIGREFPKWAPHGFKPPAVGPTGGPPAPPEDQESGLIDD
jgi:hypothetical protein